MKRLHFALVAVVALLAAPAIALGQDKEPASILLDPVTVTARGYAASQSNTPGGTGVVTREELDLSPQASLADALGNIPGLTRSGHSPWGQDISIRGLSGTSVVVLINGKRINTATDLNARLGFINPADVERVEVLKGPVSALYGSGSVGGVINIITRKADFTDDVEAHGRLSLSGSSNPWGANVYNSYSISGPRAWGFISAAHRDFSDVYGGHDDRVDNSQFQDKQGRAMLGFKPWDPLTFTLEAIQSKGHNIGIPGGVSSMPSEARVRYPSIDFTYIAGDATWDINGDYWKKLEASAYYTKNRRRVRIDNIEGMSQTFDKPLIPGGTPFGRLTLTPLEINAQASSETYGAKVQATVETKEHTLVGGVDFWTWQLETRRTRDVHAQARRITTGALLREMFKTLEDKPSPGAKQISAGVFLEDDWKLNPAVTVNLGGRIDYLHTKADPMFIVDPAKVINSRASLPQLYLLMSSGEFPFEKQLGRTSEHEWGGNLHAGFTWKMNEAWTQSLLLATNYRSADLLERYKYLTLGNNVTVIGNPDLDPERSYYAEYALGYKAQPFKAEVRVFANIITDYIQEKQVSPDIRVMDNVENASIYGVELDTRWNMTESWSLFGNIAALYGRNHETHEPLADVAPITAKVGIDYTHASGFWARLDSDMIAPQRHTPSNVEPTNGVVLLNASVGYSFETAMFKHSVALSVNNIFDTHYNNYLSHQRGSTVWEPGLSGMLTYSVEF